MPMSRLGDGKKTQLARMGIFIGDSYISLGCKSEGGSDLRLKNQAQTSGLYPSIPGVPFAS